MRKDVYITPELYAEFDSLSDYLETVTKSHLTEDGLELPNPKPLVLHTGLNAPLTLREQIDRCFAIKLSEQVSRQGMETEAEANDFEVGDSFDTGRDASKYTIMDEEYPEYEQPTEIASGDKTGNSEAPSSSKESESPAEVESPPGETQANE